MILPALVPILLLVAAPSPAPSLPRDAVAAVEAPERTWSEGPVRYLMTDAEVARFRSLTTPMERAAFIARFWAARDPDPYTPGNEGRDVFIARLRSAEELFTQTTVSGWRTDRGRIYILLGPPDEISDHPVPSVGELDLSHWNDGLPRGRPEDVRPGLRGAVEWVYRSLPSSRADAGMTLSFVRDPTGDYVLSTPLAPSFRYQPLPAQGQRVAAAQAAQMGNRPALSGASLPGKGTSSASSDSRVAGAASPTVSPGAQARAFDLQMSTLSGMFTMDQAALLEKAEPPADLRDRVRVTQYFGKIVLRSRLHFFQAPETTRTQFVLAVPAVDLASIDGEESPVDLLGRLENPARPALTYQFSTRVSAGDAPLQRLNGEDHRLFAVWGNLAPGEYQATFGVRVGPRVGAVADRVVVPEFPRGNLAIAGPLLAASVERIAGNSSADGFTLGGLTVVPRVDAVFHPGEEFAFYFQIYNAATDSADRRAHLDLTYEIARREKGLYQPRGKPVVVADSGSPVHAHVLPSTGWPPGEYLLTVSALDRTAGRTAAASAAFRILGETP